MNIRFLPVAAPVLALAAVARAVGFLLSSASAFWTLLPFLPRPLGADTPPSATGTSAAASTSSKASSSASPVRSTAASSMFSSAAASSSLISPVAVWRFLRLRPRPPRRPRRLLRRGASALPSSSFPGAASSASTEASTCSTPFGGRLSGREISLGALAVVASAVGAVCRLSA